MARPGVDYGPEEEGEADEPLVTDRGDLDQLPIFVTDRQQGEDSRAGEEDVADRLVGAVKR